MAQLLPCIFLVRMTNALFYEALAKSSAHRPSRDLISGLVLENPELLPFLVDVALDPNDKNHYKALWSLELIAATQIDSLLPHLDPFCRTISVYTHESAIRPASKICWYATAHHQKKIKQGKSFLNPIQVQKIVESCLDWLIGDYKVAPKAYAMRALFQLGKQENWILQELRPILEQDFASHTAAYKAAAKDILKKIP